MTVRLNHTIVRARDKQESARFLVEILGLPEPTTYGPFLVVQVDNDVSLDFADDHVPAHPQHYAFLIDETASTRPRPHPRARAAVWADPFHRQPREINTNDGGRGVYWDDPNGHALEILTRPYGSGS